MAKTQEDADRVTALAKELHNMHGLHCISWEMLPAQPIRGPDNQMWMGRNGWLRQAHTVYRHLMRTAELIENVEGV